MSALEPEIRNLEAAGVILAVKAGFDNFETPDPNKLAIWAETIPQDLDPKTAKQIALECIKKLDKPRDLSPKMIIQEWAKLKQQRIAEWKRINGRIEDHMPIGISAEEYLQFYKTAYDLISHGNTQQIAQLIGQNKTNQIEG
jgi:hypothetical protein